MKNNEVNLKKTIIIGISIIIGFAVLGIIGSSILFFIDIPESLIDLISSLFGIIGTVSSVILSIVAMFYSNKSSKEAEISLHKVTNHYKALCDKLSEEEIKKSLGKQGIEKIIEKNQQ